MPELAEVEIVRRNLDRWWVGRAADEVCLFDEQLVKETKPARLESALTERLERADRRGKYLVCRLAGGQVVVFHFRMTGKIICCEVPEPKYARLSWHVDGVGWLVFKDQRRLGDARVFSADEFPEYEPLRRMGPEPEDVTVDHLRGACTGRRMVKTALLDQSIVAGVGNIAVSELLWRMRWPPDVRCGDVDDEDMGRLVEEMPRYFDEIIDRSSAEEVRYVEEADTENVFDVYGREGEECLRCGGTIQRERIGGRSSYFCGECQA